MVMQPDLDLAPDTMTADLAAEVNAGAAPPRAAAVARRRRPRLLVWFSVGWLALVAACAVLADVLPLHDYVTRVGNEIRLRPGFRLHEPFGTDRFGRSELSRLIHGARVSLAVGVLSTFIGMAIGGIIGCVAGYFRGRVDKVLSVMLDSALAFPPLVLLLAIAAIMSQDLRTLILALSVLSVPLYARLARANTIAIAQREFVLAARALGESHVRILRQEIIPNVALPLLSYASIVMAALIVAEGALSFLGFGVPPPNPSWGGMIAEGRAVLETDPHIVFVPSAILFLTVLSLNTVGDWLRRRFDPKASAL